MTIETRILAAIESLITNRPDSPDHLLSRLASLNVPNRSALEAELSGQKPFAQADANAAGRTLLGLNLIEDADLPPDTVDIRDAKGRTLLRIVNVGF